MEHTVTLAVTLRTEHADLGSLERAVDAALAEAGQALWAELVRRLEAALPVPTGCLCGGTLKANGRAPRRLVTLAGEVDLRRRRFRCRACGSEVVPLDIALGLEPRIQHSLGVRERALWLVTEMSYAKTAATLDALRRLPVSHGELHHWVAAEGARIEATIVAETEAILGDQPTRAPTARSAGDVWVQADGTMVHGRTGALFEAKVGLVFRGTRRTGRTRRALVDRTYVAETANWTTFAERLVATCARLGVYDAERIFFVSDGAAAIRWIRERSFPTAIELLDWYHLTEQLKRGIGLAYPDVLERALRAAEPGDVDRLLAVLQGHARRLAGEDLELGLRTETTIGYVTSNRQAIANYRIVPLASSGPMEKGVDLTICRRFKLRGMSWYRRGVSHLLRLRILRLNGTWASYWAERFAAVLRPWPSAV
jgi:uncharacterized protein UPF0236